MTNDDRAPLDLAYRHAIDYLGGLRERPVGATADLGRLLELFGGPMPAGPAPAVDTVELLGRAVAEGGVPAASGPRFFGYVTGGTLPVAIAADWLVAAWDQTASLYNLAPAISVAEHVAAEWIVDLFGLPEGTSVGFPTGCTMAHLTALAAARHHLLAKAGWDVERYGLPGAPEVTIVGGAQRHMTIDLALRYLGFGSGRVLVVPVDERGRMRPDALAETLAGREGPIIVCAQVGDVNSGAIDPVGEISDIAHRYDAWVHVDGAFGLWAAASPELRPLVAGVEKADSWACDAHKWLNVPYDCGIVMIAHPEAHRGAMLNERAGYLPPGTPGERDAIEWVPDFSRRARSLPVWAALRTLGKSGVADLVERCCALTRRFAEQLATVPGVEALNDVVLNQVMVRFGDDDALTRDVIARIQGSGVCWFGGTTWYGRAAMRVSVVSWQTTEEDVDRSVEVVRAAVAAATQHSARQGVPLPS
ncbi:aminotransferase class V-fold PLP-dependent enzyme [Sphaerisporangium sp. TRM90804]|uniref:pyridoxal phosphate-dependent decarboxylase family protein n=1 Tax=Sphaerisporangium sp. TRM90804 TaxID=3031113 RepID=UPI00244C8258|nr:aminotransferase class V-fold PLP-dependent enzyme [Sphaerisporangium sp. TRM90804]MDH2428348.1 aminotransferase class V-fold PLP-dependent enzyme [Sphaerisporangium sp. TRM90804]